MSKLLVALFTLVTTTVFAGEIKVVSFSQYELYGQASASPKFGYNADLGRAWVEVTVSSSDSDGGSSTTDRYKIEGLSFDQQTNSIVIDHEGKITTCANLKTRGRGIFRNTSVEMAADCKFEGRWKTITYDDGFEIKKTQRYDISLVVK